MADKKSAAHAAPKPPDPTTDESLLALDARYAESPDMPVDVAQKEFASAARLARTSADKFAKVGIGGDLLDTLARYASRLAVLQKRWQGARNGVKLTAKERKLLTEAEALDTKLVAGGRWALRKDEAAQKELTRIAEGSGLVDTVQDLRDLGVFWKENADQLGLTDITAKDLARATALADALDAAAQKESDDLAAADALELRNRCFWAADELAKEIREGGRYIFKQQPKIAAKFVSRYRASVIRRSRRKAEQKKSEAEAQAPASASGG